MTKKKEKENNTKL